MGVDKFNHEGCGLPVATSVRSTEAPTEPTGETAAPYKHQFLISALSSPLNGLEI